MTWLGHLLRLDQETPARIALTGACKSVKRNIGKHKLTWITLVRKDLNEIFNLTNESDSSFFENISEICQDRANWRKIVIDYMMLNTTNM